MLRIFVIVILALLTGPIAMNAAIAGPRTDLGEECYYMFEDPCHGL